jgi:hypothetical protein
MTVQAKISQGISVVMIGKKAGGFAAKAVFVFSHLFAWV